MEEKVKLTLTIGGTTTTWSSDNEDVTFDDVLSGFLGCMFGQTFVPGTEMDVFENYIHGMKNLYAGHKE